MPKKKKKPIKIKNRKLKSKKKTPTIKSTGKVTLKHYSKFVQKAIKDHYLELKAQGTIKDNFQTYLNKSGQTFFDKFFVQRMKSAGKFRIETILNTAHSGYKRFFIKYK